jgi:hypothetical protein
MPGPSYYRKQAELMARLALANISDPELMERTQRARTGLPRQGGRGETWADAAALRTPWVPS